MGDEPDAAQRLHAEIPTRGAASGGRRAGAGGVWRVEVGGFSAFCGAVEHTAAGMAGRRAFRPRSPGGADRRHSHQRESRPGRCDWDRRGGYQTSAGVDGRATENAVVVQALIDNLLARGLDPAVPRLFIIDGSKALSRAIRRSFGRETAIQRCQIHKARNIMERLPKGLHASVRRALRQAWELDDAAKAERLIRNLAQPLEQEAPGVSGSLLEGLDEILTVTRLGLPAELRRSLACTNIIENMMGTIRRVSRNVKHWRSASMALRWTAAAMLEAKKGFRRLKAYKQLPALRVALIARSEKTNTRNLDKQLKVA